MLLTTVQSVDLSEMMVPYFDEETGQFEPMFLYRKRGLRQMRMGKRTPHGYVATQHRREEPF